MDWEDEAQEEAQAEGMPGMSAHDPLTYDPTQGLGTEMWQFARKAQMERNARERRN